MNQSRPARPHNKVTDDGRRVREVLTYSRRGSRLTPKQQLAWDAYADRYVIPDDAVDQPEFSLTGQFTTDQPLIIEIGCGVGEATAALAAARSSYNVVGFEVWHPGVAETIGRLGEAGVDNVRMSSVDAVWSMEHLVGPGQLAELWTFFPDPWHKKRHHKRRLVTPDFAALVASRLVGGGVWRLATDWADYAEQMVEVLDAEPALKGGVVPRWDDRPVTRFERRGLAEGRAPIELLYRKV
ncbi:MULTISPECIES: tRNA (guanosine(46)-N7)-methyltransferase TrmB [unclassified Nocardioides]|uniref:tRNA (guanosine(46)-N7)-methyltransferase TrmB n=1 Tax=unclassified Nocardioides TaxID=2615069 RepID=UPI00070016A3|nr:MULTISPECIES: tRNA (guanosine(46)-N7)-methyltransferase TrmB [unclassified Nocardioides]KQY56636.1 tRNA (guanine-N7)-methyltransferase [Nocardioides sp. Root140]KQZ75395.1 tRNA (guanine-N7)-methyltransferase [Nocardioides sp. Root151]